MAEKVAVNIKALIRLGPWLQPALLRAMAKGDMPALLVGGRRALSLDAALIPAKNIMPQYMKITRNAVHLIAYTENNMSARFLSWWCLIYLSHILVWISTFAI